ncbi:MAG: beta-galactosidase, partial [Candidatus Sumerlaeota bacterium]
MKHSTNPFPNGLVHGCDYNPEQWLHRPDILEKDVELMREAGINMVSIGIFSWQKIEPEEGQYTFDWMDQTIERLHGAGIKMCLATSTAAYPHWLANRYPEVMRKAAGQTSPSRGGRHNFCWTSPVYREKTASLIGQIAKRYGNHPALAAWHVNNEYGGNADANRCYCDHCVSRFQEWLQERYQGDLDALNRSWWTAFWSHGYSDWSEIVPGDSGVGGLTMNWLRFNTEQVEDFLCHEIENIRQFSDAPVTTNFHGNGMHTDDYQLARHLDFVSYDCYPSIDGTSQDHDAMIEAAWESDRMRCLLNKPWLLMESCPSQPQYKRPMRAKRPGVHRLLSLQHVAHGSEGV